MEKPVVSTSTAVQGIHPEVRNVLQIADDPAEFADHAVNLLQNSGKTQEQGRAARQFILDHYNWEHNLNNFLPCSRPAASE
jgi:glycosyltransferase involved in cell wall biosynthesis